MIDACALRPSRPGDRAAVPFVSGSYNGSSDTAPNDHKRQLFIGKLESGEAIDKDRASRIDILSQETQKKPRLRCFASSMGKLALVN